jgi:hypothetical protein
MQCQIFEPMKWTCKLKFWNSNKIDGHKELARNKKKRKKKHKKIDVKKQTCKTENKEKGEQNIERMQQRTITKKKLNDNSKVKKTQTNKKEI